MSKFNQTVEKGSKTKTVNLAGGEAYSQSDKLEFVSILLTSFVQNEFYRDSDDTLNRLSSLIDKIDDKQFIAKSAIFARDRFYMRSITHAVSAILAKKISGQDWAKDFYQKVISRPDDMAEILAYYNTLQTGKVKYPNAMKKGFAKAFDKFDNYQIAKWRLNNKEIKLVDIVNLVHPKPTIKNETSLNSLINNELKATMTWESMLSAAGQNAESSDDVLENKKEAWIELLNSGRIGYMALLRNLRNIIEQAPESIDRACELLVNEKMISGSKVLPFRFMTAYEQIMNINSAESRKVLVAIEQAINISCKNVPKFDGSTVVVLDTSSSMKSMGLKNNNPSKIGSLFAALLAKSNMCDVMTFDRDARYVTYDPNNSVISVRNSFGFSGGSTNFKAVFQTLNKKYDRIIILSDMQGFVGYSTPINEFKEYKKKFDANPFVYSWDLKNYGTMMFPEKSVFCIAGFSEKVFDIIKLMERDKEAFIKEIESIEL